MESKDEILNPAESLRVIRETIDLAKKSVQENGFHLLLWGWLIVVAGVVHYYLHDVLHHPSANLTWGIMSLIGAPVATLYEWRRKRNRRTKSTNTIHQWYGRIWLGFVLTMFFCILWSVTHQLSPTPLILAVAGFALFMSGVLLRFNPLVYGAIVFWVGAFACLPLQGAQDSLVLSAAAALGYLIPGYRLQKNAIQNHV